MDGWMNGWMDEWMNNEIAEDVRIKYVNEQNV